MKVINFVGNVDKRILVLPLVRGLAFLGETLIITDDTSYRRMIDNDSMVSGIKVLVTQEFTQTMVDDYDDGVSYNNIVFDTTSFIYENADKLIVCRNKDRRLIPGSVIDIIDKTDIEGEPEVESLEVVLTAAVPKKKRFGKKKTNTQQYLDRHEESKDKAILCPLKPGHYQWLCLCEELNNITLIGDAELIKLIAKLVSDLFEVGKGGLDGLLSRQQ